jgi:carbonic anhydrase
VKATASGGEVPPNIGSILWRLRSAVDRARAQEPNAERLVNRAVSENVAQQIEASESQSGVIKELVEKGELGIVGAVYDLSSGKVVFSLASSGH